MPRYGGDYWRGGGYWNRGGWAGPRGGRGYGADYGSVGGGYGNREWVDGYTRGGYTGGGYGADYRERWGGGPYRSGPGAGRGYDVLSYYQRGRSNQNRTPAGYGGGTPGRYDVAYRNRFGRSRGDRG